MYVWDTFRKATLRVIHLRCGFCSNFLGVTGMMARLDVLKFTPSPKKKEAWAAAYLAMDWDMGIGICYMEMGFEPVATPFRRRTDCIFVWLDY